MLGMNAHINRDLPYVLESVGLTTEDGVSRKPDHDKVNEVLARVVDPLLAELIARFDPVGFNVGIAPSTVLQVIIAWRAQAWRNAERLVAARTPMARALVVFNIESTAAAKATALAALTSYLPPFTGTSSHATSTARRTTPILGTGGLPVRIAVGLSRPAVVGSRPAGEASTGWSSARGCGRRSGGFAGGLLRPGRLTARLPGLAVPGAVGFGATARTAVGGGTGRLLRPGRPGLLRAGLPGRGPLAGGSFLRFLRLFR